MTSSLDCHPANAEETLAAHRNVFDVWPMADDIETHVEKRQVAPKMLRADYFVGTVEGRVAAALQSFPVSVLFNGDIVNALQIGSVHTHADFRRQGYAEELCDYVHQYQAERGLKLSILYSDVAPQYYGKMGYELCPAKCGYLNPQEQDQSRLQTYASLEKISLPDDLEKIQKLHDETVRQRLVAILRDDEYWQYTLKKFPQDHFYGIKNEAGQWVAYVRLNESEEGFLIHDQICQNDADDLLKQLMEGMIKVGFEQGKTKVGGWLPDNETVRVLFELTDRPKQITMIRTLNPENQLADDVLNTANYFAQIDHV